MLNVQGVCKHELSLARPISEHITLHALGIEYLGSFCSIAVAIELGKKIGTLT